MRQVGSLLIYCQKRRCHGFSGWRCDQDEEGPSLRDKSMGNHQGGHGLSDEMQGMRTPGNAVQEAGREEFSGEISP